MTPQQRATRNVRLLYAYWALRDFHLWIPVWVVFLTLERGFSLTQVTFADGCYLIGVVLLEVPTGAVADRWGRSKSLALGSLTLGVSLLLFALTQSFLVLMTSFMLWSVATTLQSGADLALLFDSLKAAGREGEYERHAGRGAACAWGAAGLATFLGGPVAAATDIRFTIFLGAGTTVAMLVVALLLWDPPHAREGQHEGYLRSIGHAARELWHAPGVRMVVLLAGTVFAALESVHYMVQPYLVDRDIEVGVLFSMLQAPIIGAGILGALIAARFSLGARAPQVLVLLALAAVACYATLAVTPGLLAFAAFPALIMLASLVQPLTTGYVNRLVGSERRATILSFQSMVASCTQGLLAPVLGLAMDHGGMDLGFATGAAAAGGAVAAFGLPALLSAAKPGRAAVTSESAA